MERKDLDLPGAGDARFDGTAPDAVLAAAVDDALIGDVLADLPEAQPGRSLTSAADFSSLYVRHRSGLAAHARRFLRDPRDVDEVVQETFLRLFLAISEIETELQAIAFARRTLTNLCIDRYRADRRRPTLITLDASAVYDVTGDEDSPDPVLQAEDAAIVRDALARLSPLHRAALVKREIEEKALPQIAAELGVAEDSVKHLLFRARRALRRLLVGTSVEPGADLSGAESTGSPLLRGATVLILFVVGALVVTTGLRPLFSGGGKPTPAVEGLGSGLPGLDPLSPHGLLGPAGHQAKSHAHGGGAAGQAVPISPTSSSNVRNATPPPPKQHRQPVRHAPVGVHASRGHFKLRGPLRVAGVPHVTQGGTGTLGDTTTGASSFSAATNHGTFELNQSVSTSATNGASVAVTPAFVIGGRVEEPDMTGSTAAVGTDAAGNVTVDVVAGAQPDRSADAFPLTSVSAQLVLTPDLSQVLSETVTLTTQPSASPQPVSAGGAPPSAGTSGSGGGSGTTPPGTSGTGTGTSDTGTSGTGTSGTGKSGTGGGATTGCPAGGTTDGSASCPPAGTGTSDTTAPSPATGAPPQPA